jgi:uncharacterized membrane protein HdeD (DUF308 family)
VDRDVSGSGLVARLGAWTRWFGHALIVVGCLTAVAPTVLGGTVVVLIGIVVLLGGLAGLAFGWRAWAAGTGAFGLVAGALGTVIGILLVANPVASLAGVTALVAVYLVLSGAATIVFGRGVPADEGRGWVMGDALLSIALGVSLWVGWPLSGLRALGLLVGVKLVSAGVVMIRLERTVSRAADRVAQVRQRLAARRAARDE